MVIRLKDTVIDSIEDTETRRLKLIRMSSKSEGVVLSLELPEALCRGLSETENVSIMIDSKEIIKGNDSRLYLEGSVFRKEEKNGLEIIGSIGGLRFIMNLEKATPSQVNSFDSERFYLTIN